MRNSSSITPTLLTFQNEAIGNPKKITIIFNNYVSPVSKKSEVKIKYLYKSYTDYLKDKKTNSFFLSPIGKEEIKLILSYLDISNTAV